MINKTMPQTRARQTKTVLIVEDEKYLREVLRDKLEHLGLNVLEASNGKEGYRIALQYKPNLILLDLVMPVMNGINMLKKISTDGGDKNVPVIIMTNVNDIKTIIEMIHYKIDFPHQTENAYTVNSDFAIKIYLESLIGRSLYDYVIKTNCKFDEFIVKIKNALTKRQLSF